MLTWSEVFSWFGLLLTSHAALWNWAELFSDVLCTERLIDLWPEWCLLLFTHKIWLEHSLTHKNKKYRENLTLCFINLCFWILNKIKSPNINSPKQSTWNQNQTLWAETALLVWVNWPFNVINPVGQPLAAEHQRILCVCVSCVPADERVAGLIPQGLSASGWLLLIWTTMTHTPILRRLCVCVCVRVCFSWSRFHHVFLLFWLHSSEQLHFKSTSFLGWSCLTPRVFFGHCGSQLSQNAFHTPPVAEWRCFVFPSRDRRSISEDSSSSWIQSLNFYTED